MTFNGDRLRLLRQFHEMTQSMLAKEVAVSQAAIADYEKPRKEPTASVQEALAVVLHVRPSFFHEHGDDVFEGEECNFRKRLAASEKMKSKVVAQACLFGVVVQRLRQEVPMPPVNLPKFSGGTEVELEESADKSRLHWGLGLDGPIDNMTRILEHAGIVTTLADDDTAEKIDAFSRYGDTNVAVLNWALGSTSRSFFNAAHELAHGVLEGHTSPRGATDPKSLEVKETEANWFAGAFLMPRKAFAKDYWAGGGNKWENFLELKRKWGASLQAIIVRAYQLCLMDPPAYRQNFRELSRQGWRTAEPEEPPPEEPELFPDAIRQLRKSPREFAGELHMTPWLFHRVTHVPVLASGDGVASIEDYIQRRDARK